jgi:cytochrome c oxidase subunit IV
MAHPEEHHDGHHTVALSTHLKVFTALIICTILTVATAKGLDLGAFNWVLAFTIATFKGFLVMAYFMHLTYDEKIYKWIISLSFFFVFLLLLFCVLDIYTRISQTSTL